jgi:hypothetical protein
MMKRVVESTRSFAYVPNFSNYNARIGDIALIAELEEVEFLPDGRCLLEAKLTGRHIITDHFGKGRKNAWFNDYLVYHAYHVY